MTEVLLIKCRVCEHYEVEESSRCHCSQWNENDSTELFVKKEDIKKIINETVKGEKTSVDALREELNEKLSCL